MWNSGGVAGDSVNRASYTGERVYLTRRGKRVAVLVPAQVLEDLGAAEDAIDLAEAANDREEDGESIPLEQVKAF